MNNGRDGMYVNLKKSDKLTIDLTNLIDIYLTGLIITQSFC